MACMKPRRKGTKRFLRGTAPKGGGSSSKPANSFDSFPVCDKIIKKMDTENIKKLTKYWAKKKTVTGTNSREATASLRVPNAHLHPAPANGLLVEGNVGIGTTSPQQRLEVTSVMRLTPTDSPGVCNVTYKGSIYYNNSLSELCHCTGASWTQVDGGGGC